MDTLFIIITIVAIVIGIAGCIVPIIPGIPLAFVAILLYGWYDGFVNITSGGLLLLAGLTLMSIIMDYILILLGNRMMGSSKYSSYGAMAGMLVGFFVFPPLGIILFCFLGAMLAEYIVQDDHVRALKAAVGATIGFLSGIVFKLAIGLFMLGYFIYQVILR